MIPSVGLKKKSAGLVSPSKYSVAFWSWSGCERFCRWWGWRGDEKLSWRCFRWWFSIIGFDFLFELKWAWEGWDPFEGLLAWPNLYKITFKSHDLTTLKIIFYRSLCLSLIWLTPTHLHPQIFVHFLFLFFGGERESGVVSFLTS